MQDIFNLIASHNWLGLFVLMALWARVLVSPVSKFPITLPDSVKPIVFAFFGGVWMLDRKSVV